MQFEVKDPSYLDNVQLVLKLTFSGEMCGVPYCEFYHAWTGESLVKLPEAISMGGEGVDTSFGESVLLPSEGAPWNSIVKFVVASPPPDYDDDDAMDENSRPRYDSDQYTAIFYHWDGKQLLLRQQNADLLNWRK